MTALITSLAPVLLHILDTDAKVIVFATNSNGDTKFRILLLFRQASSTMKVSFMFYVEKEGKMFY